MAGMFKFELVTPERVMLSADAVQVVLSGTEGDFTVLPGHAPVLAALMPSVIHVTLSDSRKAIYIKGGFAEVTPDSLSVLVEHALVADEADPRAVEAELSATEQALAKADDDDARLHLDRALQALKAIQRR
ncbi:MAG: ATP synthase F1 subunit epsilon [Hyphomicrobiaceae bacterium]